MEANTRYLVVSAAKGIQDFVLRSDKLKEMVGASEMIDQVPQSLLNETLKNLVGTDSPDKPEILVQASGCVRILFTKEATARDFLRIWPAIVQLVAPGMELVQVLMPIEEDFMAGVSHAEERLMRHRNQAGLILPVSTPVVAYSRRTGLAAVAESKENRESDTAPMDKEALRKRQVTESAHNSLLKKIVPADFSYTHQEASEKRWPVDLNRLVSDDNKHIAVVHIDANGLGQAITSLVRNKFKSFDAGRQFYKAFCQAIEISTEYAAQQALQSLLEICLKPSDQDLPDRKQVIPVRPLVCAGEDFTLVISAEHAVQFIRDYLTALENISRQKFSELANRPPDFPSNLTACAGIVFCKRNYPFAQAYELAEKLCGFSKQAVKRKHSALTFLRHKSARLASSDYENIRKELFSGPDAELTMNPYLCGMAETEIGPSITKLASLIKALRDERIPRGSLREVVTEAYQSRLAATRSFRRFIEVLKKQSDECSQELLKQLAALTGADPAGDVEDVLWNKASDKSNTPLYDALELDSLNIRLT